MMQEWFGFWDYSFMRSALLAIVLIMPLFSMLGTLVVNNGMSFFSDALGHSALTGVGIGLLLGVANTSLVMVVFAVIFALLMNRIRHSRMSSADTVIGVFSSCGIALGLVLLSRGGEFSRYQSLLIGDILSISRSELITLAITLVVALVLWGESKIIASTVAIIWGFAFALIPVGWSTWITRSLSDQAEKAGSIQVAVIQLANTCGAAVGGIALDHLGLLSPLVLSGILMLFTGLLVAAKVKVNSPA